MNYRRLSMTCLAALVLALACPSVGLVAQRGGGAGQSGARPVHRHDKSCRKWIPGGVKVVERKIWVEGTTKRVWHPPEYRTERDARGNPIQVMARRGFYETKQEPGHSRIVKQRVKTKGRWVYVCGQ